jgi:hypothetical protein
MINSLLRDDPSKGRTGTKTRTSMRDISNTLKDPGEYLNQYHDLQLCHDHLHSQKPGITIPCAQPEATRYLKIREQRTNHALRLPPCCHSARPHTKQWSLQRKGVPLHNTKVHRVTSVYDIARSAFAWLCLSEIHNPHADHWHAYFVSHNCLVDQLQQLRS